MHQGSKENIKVAINSTNMSLNRAEWKKFIRAAKPKYLGQMFYCC